MDKSVILDRLDMLVKLCTETEPERWTPGDSSLFSTQYITAMEMLKKVEDWHAGKNVQDLEGKEELISMMKCANRIWKIRNKIKNGEWDAIEEIEMIEQVEDYIAQGQKINAIKYYRQEMDDKFNEQVSLREAKEYIDQLAYDMKRRGIVK